MPDYSFCNNDGCPSKLKCARYLGVPSEWQQSYSNFQPEDGKNKCSYFMKVKEAPFRCYTVEEVNNENDSN